MGKSTFKGQEIIRLLKEGRLINDVKSKVANTANEWYRFSSKAYNIALADEKKERDLLKTKQFVSATSNEEISTILRLNSQLADRALLLPIMSTISDLNAIQPLICKLPLSEISIIKVIGRATMQPRLRVLQQKGRFEKFEHFKVFSKIIDAATLSYYRANFISCYLTLLPVIEGIIIRWMGYTESDNKPEFEDIRGFFRKSAQRQPLPSNILFHDIYVKACDKILNNHFYKPTSKDGTIAYENFNRHVASHLLNDDHFATNKNCIRLFILLDAMSEIFLYESRNNDPRFSLGKEEVDADIIMLSKVLFDSARKTPEQVILGTDFSDILM